jgi:hypothetical protein
MSRSQEPPRLLSRAPKGSLVRLALTAAHAREPTAADLRALTDSLVGLMANGPGEATPAGARPGGAAAATPTLSRRGGALLAKVGSVLVMLTLAAAGFWWTRTRASQGTRAPSTGVMARVKASSSEPLPEAARAEPTSAPPDIPAPTPDRGQPCGNPPCAGSKPQASPHRTDAPRSRPNLAPSSRTTDAVPNELQVIDAARQALRSSPARALALTDEHEQRFPHGRMAEERDVIRISALMSLGQTSRARALAREFLRLNNGSAYARRVEAVLSTPP